MTELNNTKPALFQALEKDEKLAPFLSDEFDVARFTSSSLRSGQVTEHVHLLSDCLKRVEHELNKEVIAHHNELLFQVNNISNIEQMLSVLRSEIDKLQETLDSIFQDIQRSGKDLQDITISLENIYSVCDMFRHIIRFLYLTRKLKSYLSNGIKELNKASQSVIELETMRKQYDLQGIDIIDGEITWIVKIKDDIINQVTTILQDALETQNQSSIAISLSSFYYLNMLSDRINSLLMNLREKTNRNISVLLTLTQESTPNDVNLKNSVFTRLDRVFDLVLQSYLQVALVESVLNKIQNDSNKSLISEVKRDNNLTLLQSFTRDIARDLSKHLTNTCKGSPSIEHVLVNEYPKILHLFIDLYNNFLIQSDMRKLQQQAKSLSNEDFQIWINCLSPYKVSFLNKCQSRLHDSLSKLLSSTTLPTPASSSSTTSPLSSFLNSDSVNSFLSSLSHEISLSRQFTHILSLNLDLDIIVLLSNIISDSLKLLANKIKQQVATDVTALHINLDNTLSLSQVKNIKIYNFLSQLCTSLQSMTAIQNTPSYLRNSISECVDVYDKMIVQILSPLFTRIFKLLQQTLANVIQEDLEKDSSFSSSDVSPPCSKYMKSFQDEFSIIYHSLITKYNISNYSNNQLISLINRLILTYLRLLSCIKSGNDKVKMKLTQDMAQFEFSLTQVSKVKDLNNSYLLLRSFKQLLYRDLSLLSSSPEIDILPPSIILHHLISKSNHKDLQLPYMDEGIPLLQYLDWWDTHSEREVYQKIKQSVDRYVSKVNMKGETHYIKEFTIIQAITSRYFSN